MLFQSYRSRAKAAARLDRERKESGIVEPPKAGTLLPAEESIAVTAPPPEPEAPLATALAQEARQAMAAEDEDEDVPDAESVFAKLKELKSEPGA